MGRCWVCRSVSGQISCIFDWLHIGLVSCISHDFWEGALDVWSVSAYRVKRRFVHSSAVWKFFGALHER